MRDPSAGSVFYLRLERTVGQRQQVSLTRVCSYCRARWSDPSAMVLLLAPAAGWRFSAWKWQEATQWRVRALGVLTHWLRSGAWTEVQWRSFVCRAGTGQQKLRHFIHTVLRKKSRLARASFTLTLPLKSEETPTVEPSAWRAECWGVPSNKELGTMREPGETGV